MSTRRFSMPFSVLVREAGRLHAALTDEKFASSLSERLEPNFAAEFKAQIAAVSSGGTAQKSKIGSIGTLTAEQQTAWEDLTRLMSGARRSAALAFPGQDVVLRAEFQRGVHEPQTLAAELERANMIAASCQKHAGALKTHGWIARDTEALLEAIKKLSEVDTAQEASKDEGPELTAQRTAAANALYISCLTVQNAARLQYPSTQPGTEEARRRFLLDEFPPRNRESPDAEAGDTPSDAQKTE